MASPPVPLDGPFVPIATPSEFAASLQAISWLNRVVYQHNQERNHHDQEADNRSQEAGDDGRGDHFRYGQDFDTEPEVWDPDGDWFRDEGVFGPIDPEDYR